MKEIQASVDFYVTGYVFTSVADDASEADILQAIRGEVESGKVDADLRHIFDVSAAYRVEYGEGDDMEHGAIVDVDWIEAGAKR